LMEFYEVVSRRRSIRAYKPDPVEEDKLFRILEAARLAPSAANRQPWHFIVVRDPQKREQLRKAYDRDWFVKAPVIIVACADPTKAWRRRDGEEYWKVDVAIAMEHLVLAAANEGLGTCWIGAFDEKAVKEVLGIPEHIRVVAMTPLGYPAEEKGPVTDRKPLEEIVHYDGW
jgi:nitroreductase